MNINHNFPRQDNLLPSTVESADHQYDSATVSAVWDKAEKEFGFYFFKRDPYGEVIAKHEYGKKTQYGWEITHSISVSRDSTDSIENLQPVHWKNVQKKGDQ